MKNEIRSLLTIIGICLVLISPAPIATAQTPGPGQKQKPRLFLLSRTDITTVKDEVLAGIYQSADASLIEKVRDGLASRDIPVEVVKSGQDIVPDPGQFILVVKIENIELGRKRPFGRTARVKVSYAFQNRDRFELVRRTVEETSAQKWQNCIDKISGQIAADTSSDLAKQSEPGKANRAQSRALVSPGSCRGRKTLLATVKNEASRVSSPTLHSRDAVVNVPCIRALHS